MTDNRRPAHGTPRNPLRLPAPPAADWLDEHTAELLLTLTTARRPWHPLPAAGTTPPPKAETAAVTRSALPPGSRLPAKAGTGADEGGSRDDAGSGALSRDDAGSVAWPGFRARPGDGARAGLGSAAGSGDGVWSRDGAGLGVWPGDGGLSAIRSGDVAGSSAGSGEDAGSGVWARDEAGFAVVPVLAPGATVGAVLRLAALLAAARETRVPLDPVREEAALAAFRVAAAAPRRGRVPRWARAAGLLRRVRADGAAVRPGRVAAVAAAVSVLAMGGVAMAMATTGRLLPPGQGAGGGPVNRPPAAVSSGKATSAPPRRPASPAPPAARPLPSAPYRDGCRTQSRTPYCARASREATPHAGQRQRHPGSWPYRATGRPDPPGAPGPTGPTGPGRLTPVGPSGQTGRSAHAGPRPGRAPHASHSPAARNGQVSHGRWSDDGSGDTYAR